jgi:hypothetical protein
MTRTTNDNQMTESLRIDAAELAKRILHMLDEERPDVASFALTLCLKTVLDELPPEFHEASIDLLNDVQWYDA